ncbi:MAG TPA: GtrA family protein [Terriglobia bacterium]|nr:GtrA family protein [Terriglobia bacterium]
MRSSFRTWIKFNAVGIAGVGVQLSVLTLLKSGVKLHYLAATAIAVEAAVLHNFVWHERWTWFERTRAAATGVLPRLARFHLTNGIVSICGNLALMWMFVSRFGVSYFFANLLAIATCSVANFWASERFVFRRVMLGLVVTVLVQPPALYEDSAADRLIRTATESTYMLHLSDARTAAHDLQRKYPDHPAGFLIEAETFWWEAQEDPGNKKIENDYYRAQNVAQQKAERAVQAAKYYKPELLAYLASAYASYARFQVTQKDSYFTALRAGLKAHDYAEQVYALDKNYYDIYVGLAAFNYFSGTLPSMIRPFAWLFGANGEKSVGINQFQTAMEKARYSRTEARIVYYSALLSNDEYAGAFPILEKLIADYPDNFVLYDWAEEWFHEQKKWEGSTYFEQIYEKQARRSPLMAQYALLEKASLQLDAGLKAEASQTLQRIRTIRHTDAVLFKKVDALAKSAR